MAQHQGLEAIAQTCVNGIQRHVGGNACQLALYPIGPDTHAAFAFIDGNATVKTQPLAQGREIDVWRVRIKFAAPQA